jgi:hypothetical protein
MTPKPPAGSFAGPPGPSWSGRLASCVLGMIPTDRREQCGLRELDRRTYFGLFLFGLFNPVVASMRVLCSATRLGRVQQGVGQKSWPRHKGVCLVRPRRSGICPPTRLDCRFTAHRASPSSLHPHGEHVSPLRDFLILPPSRQSSRQLPGPTRSRGARNPAFPERKWPKLFPTGSGCLSLQVRVLAYAAHARMSCCPDTCGEATAGHFKGGRNCPPPPPGE